MEPRKRRFNSSRLRPWQPVGEVLPPEVQLQLREQADSSSLQWMSLDRQADRENLPQLDLTKLV